MTTNNSDDRFSNLSFPGQVAHYSGKVRETYQIGDKRLVMVTTDRISAFDRILERRIPSKGIILNLITIYFLKALGNAVPHWFLTSPHPRVLIGIFCKPFKFEVVLRQYLVGSLWRDKYNKGERTFWGYTLPDGMKENEKLPQLMITPTTKAEEGHDEDITKEEIIAQNLCSSEQWALIEQYAFKLFQIGTTIAAERGLILVDTKYEFGIDHDGVLRVIDEVHTPDSSRYFYANEYASRFEKGERQKQLSKEFVREWLLEHNFQGKEGQVMPEILDDDNFIILRRYEELFTVLTGEGVPGGNVNNDAETIVSETVKALQNL